MRKAAWISLLPLVAAMLLLNERGQIITFASRVTGPVRVIDGDDLAIGERPIRILGIDASERDQTCQDTAGQTWHCGEDARHALAHVARQQVSCHVARQDRYGRDLARCATGGTDLVEWLVRKGWAIPAGDEQDRYRAARREAEASRTGIWAGSFMPPGDWRRAGDPQRREGAGDER